MKLLLDTHIILWALTDDPSLPGIARKLIADSSNTVMYSPVSLWEVEIKHAIHPEKLSVTASKVNELCQKSGYTELPLQASHVEAIATLERLSNVPKHQDPFDRALIAQAKAENVLFMTHDARIAEYAEKCIFSI